MRSWKIMRKFPNSVLVLHWKSGELWSSPRTWTGFRAAIRTDPDPGNGSRRRIPSAEKGHTLEFLKDIAHLRPRTNTLEAVFRIRNTLSQASSIFPGQGFYIHTPIITDDAEGAGEMFHVTLDLEQPKTKAERLIMTRIFSEPMSV